MMPEVIKESRSKGFAAPNRITLEYFNHPVTLFVPQRMTPLLIQEGKFSLFYFELHFQ
jgi:hypothetical protein